MVTEINPQRNVYMTLPMLEAEWVNLDLRKLKHIFLVSERIWTKELNTVGIWL